MTWWAVVLMVLGIYALLIGCAYVIGGDAKAPEKAMRERWEEKPRCSQR